MDDARRLLFYSGEWGCSKIDGFCQQAQNAQKLSAEKVADEAGMSRDQVRRFIRLTELITELMTKVDNKEIGVTPAVELSYLTQEEQVLLLDAMESEQAVPSYAQS